ncbi:MAG: DNA gyrase modulator, partial [Sandaracinaceae bacterium]
MATENQEELLAMGERVVERARKAGADVAEAVVSEGSHLSTKVRLGEPELVEEAGSRAVGLRVMVGKQVAVSYTSDLTEAGVARFVEDAIELARLSQPDELSGPPDPSQLSKREEHAELNLYDASIHDIDGAEALAHA